jgi:hypothetical protein
VHFSAFNLLQFHLCYYILQIIISYTCWVPIVSVLIPTISPSNLLLRRRRWCVILQRGVLGLHCPSCIFLWIMEPSGVLLPRESFSVTPWFLENFKTCQDNAFHLISSRKFFEQFVRLHFIACIFYFWALGRFCFSKRFKFHFETLFRFILKSLHLKAFGLNLSI